VPTTADHNEDDPLRRRIEKLLAAAELTQAKMDAARARMEATEAEAGTVKLAGVQAGC
jgi:hypothetical protein